MQESPFQQKGSRFDFRVYFWNYFVIYVNHGSQTNTLQRESCILKT